jgi:hypothetical protein
MALLVFRQSIRDNPSKPVPPDIAGHSASENARKRADDPAIHLTRKKEMDPRVKPAGDDREEARFRFNSTRNRFSAAVPSGLLVTS